MTSFISCLDQKSRTLVAHEVHPNVAIYIRQLEAALKYGLDGGVRRAYPGRFDRPENTIHRPPSGSQEFG